MEEKVVIKKPPKSPGLAGVLAIFLPFGVGALYNNQIRKAIIFFFTFAGLVTLQKSAETQPFLGLLLFGFYIYQIYDAIQNAKDINRRALQQKEEELPEEEEIPEFVKTGSIFWGIFLMVIGSILLLANFGMLNYKSLFEFWPVVVIAIGLKLIVDHFSKTRN